MTIHYNKHSINSNNDKGERVSSDATREKATMHEIAGTYCKKLKKKAQGQNTTRKIKAPHMNFIRKQIADNPDISKEELYNALNDSFPSLHIALSTLEIYIRNNFPGYNEMLKRRLGAQRKATQTIELEEAHIEYLKEKLKNNDKFSITKLHKSLLQAFPHFKIGKITLWKHMKTTLKKEYDSYKERKLNRTEHFYK